VLGTNDDELTREIEAAEKRADEARKRADEAAALEAEDAPAEDYGEAPERDEEQPTPPARQ
jgi:septal ring factor EnvC (AmiA/AmiB activator)